MPSTTLKRERLRSLLTAAGKARIAVVGDAMLDLYLRGDVDRISPEAPVPVVRVRERRAALGGAANVAQNVVGLGASVELVAAVGEDEGGARIRSMLGEIRAPLRGLVAVNRPTTTKTRILARSQQLARVDEEDDADLRAGDVKKVLKAVSVAVADADALILEDYNKGVLVPPVIEGAIAAARKKGIPVVVDPKYRNFFAYKGATIFKPNRRELEAALGASVNPSHPETLPALVEKLSVDAILLTLSEQGMLLIQRGKGKGRVSTIPTTAREVFDVVGAGDTVTAYLAAILAAGGSPLDAAIIANYAAGVEVGKLGAATVSPAEILEAFEEHRAR